MADWWIPYIRQGALARVLDPDAVLAVAGVEGLSGAPGDNNTSWGPFQLHVGGALPQGRDRKWAESQAGINYALDQIAGVAKGLKGQQAIKAIVTRFERPAKPQAEIERALATYRSGAGSSNGRTLGPEPRSGGSTPSPAAIPGQMTPQDYRRQAALTALGGIAMGAKPTDTLTQTATAFRQHPLLPPSTTRLMKPTKPVEDGSSLGQAIVATAAKQIGQPYVWGGESRAEGGFDCSGLVDFAMRQHGYQGGRITTETVKGMGHSVLGQTLAPGDLILANGGNHVVIYAGNGRVISAPHAGAKVRYQSIRDYKITDIRRPY